MKFLGFDVRSPLARSPKMDTRDGEFVSDLKDPSAWLLNSLLGAAQNATGITVTPIRALGVASVFACVRVLSDAVGSMPLNVLKREGKSVRIATEHRLYSALQNMPNEEMTSTDARSAMQANLSLRSNCYAEILRDIDSDPIGFYPIEAGKMDFYRDSFTKKLRYRSTETGAVFDAKDVIHVRANTFNGLKGLDLTTTVRECIALAVALQDNAAKFFGNGSQPSGVLEHPNSLSTDAQERLRNQIESQVGGKNLYRLLVLEEGLKYSAQRTANKDSQFDESRQAQDLNICRVFGVPPHKIGILSGQPRANVEQDNISFVIDTLRPICVRWEQTFNAKLFTEEERQQGYFVRHDFNALLRGDKKSQSDALALGRQWGWLSANDCREIQELEPLPPEVGDIYLQPLNMADAKSATAIQLKAKGAPGATDPMPTEPNASNNA